MINRIHTYSILFLLAWFIFLPVYALDSVTNKAHGLNFYPQYPKPDLTKGNPALILRGEYLVKVGDCIACHTNTPGGGKVFAGGLPLNTPFGTFFSANITPDKETGIGNWSNKDFIRAMHEGINPHGKYYFPVFPYTSFTKVNDNDLIAIKAYLDSIPAVHQPNKKPTAPWPFSWRFSQLFWRLMFFDKGYYQYNPNRSAKWNRGAYIVQGLGHCGECHTPRNFLGAMKQKYYLTGAIVDGYWAPDITSLEFKGKSISDIVDVFSHDELLNDAGTVRGPMAEVDHNSLQNLSRYDLEAIALYLKSVNSPQPREEDLLHQQRIANGQDVYQQVCAICHDKGVAGAPMIYDTYNWQNRLSHGGLDALYNHAIEGYNSMPPRGGCVTCTDADVKAAVDFILSESSDASQIEQIKAAKIVPPDTSIARGKIIYQKACYQCHEDGRLGAPKLGDQIVWKRILAVKSIDGLFRSVLFGAHHTTARRTCINCKNSDYLAAVKYIAQQGDPERDYSLW